MNNDSPLIPLMFILLALTPIVLQYFRVNGGLIP
jgi:hypothetical protein